MEEPAGKRARYSLQADVEVVVDDGTALVHSQVLMSASEVFTNMLQSNMLEASSGRIILKEKTLQGFKQVLKHLDLRGGAAPPDVTTDNVELLLQYADEYQMTGLKARCDKFLQDLCGKQAEYVLDLSNTYNLTEAKQAATRQLARVHEGPLLRYEADTTVRQTVYTELLQTIRKSTAAFEFKLGSKDEDAEDEDADEEEEEDCEAAEGEEEEEDCDAAEGEQAGDEDAEKPPSDHWKVILAALAELKNPRGVNQTSQCHRRIRAAWGFDKTKHPNMEPTLWRMFHHYLTDYERTLMDQTARP